MRALGGPVGSRQRREPARVVMTDVDVRTHVYHLANTCADDQSNHPCENKNAQNVNAHSDCVMSPITISTLKWPLYDRNEDSIKTEN